MFDTVKTAIDAAETVLSNFRYTIDSCKSELQYWEDMLVKTQDCTTGYDVESIEKYINYYTIEMEMYTAMEDSVKAVLRKYIKNF